MSLKKIAKECGIALSTASLWARQGEANLYARGVSDAPTPSALFSLFGAHPRKEKEQKGRISEAAVLLRLAALDLVPYASPFDCDTADWVVYNKETCRMHRLQVRSVAEHPSRGNPMVSVTRTSNGVRHCYKPGDFDFLVGYWFVTDTAYVWSWSEVADRTRAIGCSTEAAERWDKIVPSYRRPG